MESLEKKQLKFVCSMIDHYFGGVHRIKLDGQWVNPKEYLINIKLITTEGQLIANQTKEPQIEAVKYYQSLLK